MKKKLNLVLRDPVKLHKSEQTVLDLPSPFIEKKNAEINESEAEKNKAENIKVAKIDQKTLIENVKKVEKKKEINDNLSKIKIEDVREKMSLRIKQVWEYFCAVANKDGELQNSFTVTRAEVMKSAGIGSTNTYRDALKKFQDLDLLRIELRPGVNAGSIFHLTENGIKQAEIIDKKLE